VKYYADAKFYKKAKSEESRIINEYKTRITLLSKLADKYRLRKYLIDIGCASGLFMKEAQKSGWTVEGIELSPKLSGEAQKEGLAVNNGLAEDLLGNKKYSIVTAWEVLEHSIEPKRFLESLRDSVQNGGLIAITTPLSNGIPARFLKLRYPMVLPKEHICLFSKKALKMLGENMGLQMVRFRSFSNLTHKKIENNLLRSWKESKIINNIFEKGILAALALGMLPLTKVMDKLGMGSQMEIIFRRIG
jgi:2-polyprenyl-3-methyl-5-hydroxy-6-metoxy-1,4-benzoquinol methylase